MSEDSPFRPKRAEQFFARIIETLPDGSVTVRKVGDGREQLIDAHQARRIARSGARNARGIRMAIRRCDTNQYPDASTTA